GSEQVGAVDQQVRLVQPGRPRIVPEVVHELVGVILRHRLPPRSPTHWRGLERLRLPKPLRGGGWGTQELRGRADRPPQREGRFPPGGPGACGPPKPSVLAAER